MKWLSHGCQLFFKLQLSESHGTQHLIKNFFGKIYYLVFTFI